MENRREGDDSLAEAARREREWGAVERRTAQEAARKEREWDQEQFERGRRDALDGKAKESGIPDDLQYLREKALSYGAGWNAGRREVEEESARRFNVERATVSAKQVLKFYFRLAIGEDKWSSDNEAEIDDVVDSIIFAAKGGRNE